MVRYLRLAGQAIGIGVQGCLLLALLLLSLVAAADRTTAAPLAQESTTAPDSATAAGPGTGGAPAAAAVPTEARQMAMHNVPSGEPAPSAWPPGLLMTGLGAVGVAKPLDDLGLRTWGYFESSFTGRLSGGYHPLLGRLYDARRPNNVRFNQLDLTVDRPYDATKNVDFGGRIDGLFGGDAMLTHARGLFDHAGEGESDAWADLLQFYGQAWFKTGADSGLEVTFGKFLELAGSESATATSNVPYSHSYLYSFAEPTTQTGAMAKYIVNPQWFGYVGAVEGWDVFRDNNDSASIISGGGWSSLEQIGGHARAQVLLNIITGPEQQDNSRDYRNLTDIVVNYWWRQDLEESLNVDWLTEKNVPGVAGRANAYGPAHYLTYVFNESVSGTWRTEWFRDQSGARTGTDANWFENTWGVCIKPFPKDKVLKNLLLRPELRWDFADQAVFGGRSNQLTVGFDLIFEF